MKRTTSWKLAINHNAWNWRENTACTINYLFPFDFFSHGPGPSLPYFLCKVQNVGKVYTRDLNTCMYFP